MRRSRHARVPRASDQQAILAEVEGFSAAPDEILAMDDAGVIARGRHSSTGAVGALDARVVHIWTVTDGLVSRYEQFADTRGFCDASGIDRCRLP